jgi:hypothetical protein
MLKKCLEFACEHVHWSESQWSRVIFTDEKKWNLLGNDAYISVWIDNHSTYCLPARQCHPACLSPYKGIKVPPQSPYLSPIEGIWGIMSEKVYKNGKTYPNVEELWYEVVGAFFQIPQEAFQKLCQSMYTRLINVLESGGKRIKY